MTVFAATDSHISEAAASLRDGKLISFPTETVYGLGVDARNGRAIARLFEIKGRPQFNPLIVHLGSLADAEQLVEFNQDAERLADAFWPGPLTLVLPKRSPSPLSELVSAGLDTVALRIPSHQVAQSLLKLAAIPVAAPSANKSGHVSPTRADHVVADFGPDAFDILDGGPCERGLESTVVGFDGRQPVILRPGATTVEDIETALGRMLGFKLASSALDTPTSPGQLASHYAPVARVRLNTRSVGSGEALLAFGPNLPAFTGSTANLSEAGDLQEAAANLFAALRALDKTGVQTIAVMPIPDSGLGAAINDRLRRAAARNPN
ncbi:threonylcarbamoyl-AMP synthase [bacterium MnTg02]|nr:threonylcarbamoyl-AMP synthase [bacterium MnTg02]